MDSSAQGLQAHIQGLQSLDVEERQVRIMSAITDRSRRGRAGHTTRYPAGEAVASVPLQRSSRNSGQLNVGAIRGLEFVIPSIKQELILKENLAFSKLSMTTNTDRIENVFERKYRLRREE